LWQRSDIASAHRAVVAAQRHRALARRQNCGVIIVLTNQPQPASTLDLVGTGLTCAALDGS